MQNYLEARISYSESFIRSYKKTQKIYIGLLITIIAIGAFDMWAHSLFGLGMMTINALWFLCAIIENNIDLRHEQEMLKFYQQQDFRDTQDRILESYNRSSEHYANLVKQMTPDSPKGNTQCQS